MTGHRRGVSIIIHEDGALDSKTFRVPLVIMHLLLGLGVALAVCITLGLAFFVPIARQAARVPGLRRDVQRLSTDNLKIRALASALDSAEARYGQVRRMMGADIIPDPVVLGSTLPVAPVLYVRPPRGTRRLGEGPSLPTHWPLDEAGYVTRGQVDPDSIGRDTHPGLDVAIPIGRLVRASGGGVVLQTGEEPEYGLFVLIQHADGYQSMYGHLSRITAIQGEPVNAGEVVGRSGNSGRSSAPHLHFEVRLNGVAVDPATVLKEDH